MACSGKGLRLLVALGDHPGTPTRYRAKSSPNSYSDDESSARSFQGWLNHPGVAGKFVRDSDFRTKLKC